MGHVADFANDVLSAPVNKLCFNLNPGMTAHDRAEQAQLYSNKKVSDNSRRPSSAAYWL